MRTSDRFRALLFRWDRVAFFIALTVPFMAASLFGFVWLWERGWLLWFVITSLVFVSLVRGARALASWQTARKGGDAALSPLPDLPPMADPEWSPAEHEALARARERLKLKLTRAIDWEKIPSEALSVVEGVAVDLSGGKRGVLDFTAPEALLLMSRLSTRYRDLIRTNVPFADRVSIQSLWWIWQRQDRALDVASKGWMIWRGVRLIANPATAIFREAERLLANTLQDRAGAAMIRDLQYHLLDEAAQAAVDLYSGRLRFTDEELSRARLPEMKVDEQITETKPLRVVVLGQLSAGKSSLINALVGEDVAETDAAPVTDRTSAHEFEIEGIGFRLIDTPGLDGGDRRREMLIEQIERADLLIWVLRTDRPDRSPDVLLREAWEAAKLRAPGRRSPPTIVVAAAADRLFPSWPWPEHALPRLARQQVEQAMERIGADWGSEPLPISTLSPEWNLDALRGAMLQAVPEARQVQRQRMRLAASRLNAGEVVGQAKRGLRSLGRKVTEGIRGRFGG